MRVDPRSSRVYLTMKKGQRSGHALPRAGPLPGGFFAANIPKQRERRHAYATDARNHFRTPILRRPRITIISPDGASVEYVPTGDPLTTNICFGGPDLRIAYITLSGQGKLVAMDWPRPGLKLHYTR